MVLIASVPGYCLYFLDNTFQYFITICIFALKDELDGKILLLRFLFVGHSLALLYLVLVKTIIEIVGHMQCIDIICKIALT